MNMTEQQVVFTNDICRALTEFTTKIQHDRLFILFDTETLRYCMPLIMPFMDEYERAHGGDQIPIIIIEPTDAAKNITSLTEVWDRLSAQGATRHSLLINVGGGMVTDLGGFAAATFKRGISFINVATTLLGAVDAAVGGKTGINHNGLKNEVGVFAPAAAVLISSAFFDTLDRDNLLSGYAEMLKHSMLISQSEHFYGLLEFDVINKARSEEFLSLLETSVEVKRKVVRQDPYEQGRRKALNLGHTFGHAFESYCMRRQQPVLHGYAVAWGLVCEAVLSHLLCGFPTSKMNDVAQFVRDNYGVPAITCEDYDELYELMTHDKKNEAGDINFTLLRNLGDVAINQTASKEQIGATLDIFRDLMGI